MKRAPRSFPRENCPFGARSAASLLRPPRARCELRGALSPGCGQTENHRGLSARKLAASRGETNAQLPDIRVATSSRRFPPVFFNKPPFPEAFAFRESTAGSNASRRPGFHFHSKTVKYACDSGSRSVFRGNCSPYRCGSYADNSKRRQTLQEFRV